MGQLQGLGDDPLFRAARRAEKRVIAQALELTHYNRKKAAQLLDISYKGLLYKMKECGIGKRLNPKRT